MKFTGKLSRMTFQTIQFLAPRIINMIIMYKFCQDLSYYYFNNHMKMYLVYVYAKRFWLFNFLYILIARYNFSQIQ